MMKGRKFGGRPWWAYAVAAVVLVAALAFWAASRGRHYGGTTQRPQTYSSTQGTQPVDHTGPSAAGTTGEATRPTEPIAPQSPTRDNRAAGPVARRQPPARHR